MYRVGRTTMSTETYQQLTLHRDSWVATHSYFPYNVIDSLNFLKNGVYLQSILKLKLYSLKRKKTESKCTHSRLGVHKEV